MAAVSILRGGMVPRSVDEAVGAGQKLDRVRRGRLGLRSRPRSSMTCMRCLQASGQSDTTRVSFFCAAWRGRLADLHRDLEFSFGHPRCRRGRSSAHTGDPVSGISRSISAALAPMFCARAWQAWCR